ncbi:MAG TPA: cytochrome c biogenesis protein CcdA [Blastocatellia bacterium]|nr:cytochrome c biogenesis protein CcdA [Blastocatellia bacterium]
MQGSLHNRLWQTGLMLTLLLSVSALIYSQRLNVVAWSGKLDKAQVRPGEKAKLVLTAKIDPGWHLYSLTQPPPPRATKIALADGAPFVMDGNAQQSKPVKAYDPNFQIETETFENTATFTVPVKAAADVTPGPQKLIAKVTFQACDEHQCLPPRTREVETEVMIVAAGAAVAPAQTATPKAAASVSVSPAATAAPSVSPSVTPTATPASSSSVSSTDSSGAAPTLPGSDTLSAANASAERLKQKGLLGYLWFALGFGFLALLTPCVFPMIPITVSFFTKKENQTRGQAVGQALIYCFGIIFTFTGLGILLTLVAGPTAINRLAANAWMNIFLTLLFVIFALNLFGMFEIRVPSGLLSKLDSSVQGGSGVAATLLMGLTFTLTSFTCTAAFVGTVLVAATQGERTWAALGMLAFSTAFALPFFLLALFPSWLKSLPKSGGWLNSVKVVMGFLELAAAFKFISNVDLVWGWNTVSRSLVLAAWIAIAIVTAIYLLGKFQLPYDSPVERLGVMRMLVSVLFLGVAFYLLTGLLGARLGELDSFLPPARPGELAGLGGGTVAQSGGLKWTESYDEALAQAKAQNKPAFLNFTGVTCTNCRWMETNMFPQPEVRKELERFVLAELFTDRDTPEHAAGDERNQQLQEKQFGTVALPLYVIVGPDGREITKFPGLTRDPKEFIRFLQAGAGQFAQVAQKQ